jgi:SOS-response transcriptional repressor LexA
VHLIQQKLLKLVDVYNLGSLTLREIGTIIGDCHPQTIKHHLEALERKGLIEWNRDLKTLTRCRLGVATDTDFVIVPVVGTASCGIATMYAEENVMDHLKVSLNLLKRRRNVFAVRAVGHSMNLAQIDGKSIEDGDWVIVDRDDRNIRSNDYVVSIIDEMAVIKKIFIDEENSQIKLISESNQPYPSIFISMDEATKFIVNGKVFQVIKS